LADLIEAGLAIRLDNGRYAHSVQMLQIAQSYTNQVANLHAQINETNQRIMAGIME
jgi:putative prophage DNA-binding protein